jgi:mRNA interferase MazF
LIDLRPIHAAFVGAKVRPVLVLNRAVALGYLSWVSVAPITSTIRGLAVEVLVGPSNGLDHDGVVNLDNVVTINKSDLGARIGYLLSGQEPELTAALHAAYDLD